MSNKRTGWRAQMTCQTWMALVMTTHMTQRQRRSQCSQSLPHHSVKLCQTGGLHCWHWPRR
jgi:hypothetical protein